MQELYFYTRFVFPRSFREPRARSMCVSNDTRRYRQRATRFSVVNIKTTRSNIPSQGRIARGMDWNAYVGYQQRKVTRRRRYKKENRKRYRRRMLEKHTVMRSRTERVSERVSERVVEVVKTRTDSATRRNGGHVQRGSAPSTIARRL